ncbi:hypothetical protein ACTWP5_21945 [Streptomyces sp. 4N509B]|uniref:hypothetical protein n=1 Tax=Streptomyces sp. 4N509B TaxID=3457413 RepID=UPI003FD2420F
MRPGPARLVAYLTAGLVALGAATYVVVYLYRWQWQRAILSGVLLLVAEVLLLGLVVLGRLTRLERRLADGDRRQEEILAQLRAADQTRDATDHGDGRAAARFAWLDQAVERERHTFVFVPVLMAAGAALSGLAWLVERVARRTVRPSATRRLAARLAPLAAPPGGVAEGAPDLPDRPALGPAPGRGGRRGWLTAVGWLALGLACVGLVVGLAGLTQTAPPRRGGDHTATTVLFTLDSRGLPAGQAELAARQQWERCRDATSIPLAQAGMTVLDDNLYAATIHPSLSEHDETRLLGCLQDATIDRVQLHVIGTSGVTPVAEAGTGDTGTDDGRVPAGDTD